MPPLVRLTRVRSVRADDVRPTGAAQVPFQTHAARNDEQVNDMPPLVRLTRVRSVR
eukprot:CAMPEP_0198512326 /NCGR_PEP_ID=MMETSP1462-20131121/15376_1 /TAXON_ID=1333877 /ORGANISM="Brandtodinium nutriculum, Strain RCC3387" /LENGTH=55 /DNA_ID=CAMNT_0044241731 /DNA_START=51 /DNA_END=215 /DNA_ORIENTATION=-